LVLAPNESAVISGIPMQMGDVLKGQTTNGSTVDYVLGESGPGPFKVELFNSTGAGKAVASTDGMISASLTQSPGASTAAAGTTTADAGVLPASTAGVYPTTGADDTKGVRIHASDQVTGRRLFIGNGVSNKILKVYPPTGGTINGAAANAAFSSARARAWTSFASTPRRTPGSRTKRASRKLAEEKKANEQHHADEPRAPGKSPGRQRGGAGEAVCESPARWIARWGFQAVDLYAYVAAQRAEVAPRAVAAGRRALGNRKLSSRIITVVRLHCTICMVHHFHHVEPI
jgi:hypothetical protein